MIELPILLPGQGAPIGTDLRTLLASEGSLLGFQLPGFPWGKSTVTKAVGNLFLLPLFSAIDFRSSRMVMGKPIC
jgi:hypothetical protein